MNSKQRVLTAINHEEADRVPLDVWLPSGVSHELAKRLGVLGCADAYALPKRLGHDLLKSPMAGVCEGFSSTDYPQRKIGDNLYQDKFGIQWRLAKHEYGAYCEFAAHPLADSSAYSHYQWPDPLAAEQEALDGCAKLVAAEGRDYAIMGCIPCTIFECAWYLRGLENLLMDLAAQRDFADELFERAMGYALPVSKKMAELGVDIVWWGDDVSHERGPMLKPADFRSMIKPRYAYMAQEVRKVNKDVKIAFHSDGAIEWMLDDLADIGFDIINPLQPDANDVAAFKKRYGKRFTVWGNVDTRVVMSSGSVTDVIEEVKHVIRVLAPGGGHIFCSNHSIQDTARALENTVSFYWAFNQFNQYPIRL
jgi:uroporphyrinogen decarboxylase